MGGQSGGSPAADINQLLGAGFRAARERRGWRQEDAAREFRYHGLTTWRRTTVADIEAGRRHPSLAELLLAALALRVSLADLLPGASGTAGQRVDMGGGATMAVAEIRGLLSADWAAVEAVPVAQANRVPGRTAMVTAMRVQLDALGAEQERVLDLVQPIADAAGHELTDEDWAAAYGSASEAEIRAARRLGVEPAELRLASRVLWSRSFEDERDERAAAADGGSVSALRAHRGHVARGMSAELREFFARLDTNTDTAGGSA